MNRRGFIKGIALSATAVPLLLPELGKADVLTPEKAVIAPSLTKTRPPSMFLVCKTHTRANSIWNAMGRPTNVHPYGMGGAICGRQANLVVMDDFGPDCGPSDKRTRDWFNQTIRTRLSVDGEITTYKQERPLVFDYDNECGIHGEWRGRNRSARTGTRFMRPAKTIRGQDMVETAAQQILWFARKYHGFVPEFRTLEQRKTEKFRRYHLEQAAVQLSDNMDEQIFRSMTDV